MEKNILDSKNFYYPNARKNILFKNELLSIPQDNNLPENMQDLKGLGISSGDNGKNIINELNIINSQDYNTDKKFLQKKKHYDYNQAYYPSRQNKKSYLINSFSEGDHNYRPNDDSNLNLFLSKSKSEKSNEFYSSQKNSNQHEQYNTNYHNLASFDADLTNNKTKENKQNSSFDNYLSYPKYEENSLNKENKINKNLNSCHINIKYEIEANDASIKAQVENNNINDNKNSSYTSKDNRNKIANNSTSSSNYELQRQNAAVDSLFNKQAEASEEQAQEQEKGMISSSIKTFFLEKNNKNSIKNLRIASKNISNFMKIEEIGQGTYGSVCKYK